jgi:hypothetical protein
VGQIGLTPSTHLGYPETLAQSCVCASAGIFKLHAVPGVPQASGSEIVGLRCALNTVQFAGVLPAPDLWNAGGSAHCFRAAIGLGLDSSWVIDLEIVRSAALPRLPPVRD